MIFAPSQDPLAITLLVLPETSLMTLAAMLVVVDHENQGRIGRHWLGEPGDALHGADTRHG